MDKNEEHAAEAEEYKIKGNDYYKQKNYDQALVFYKKALAINSAYKEAWFNTGMTHKALQQYEKAQEAFKRAVEIDPLYEKASYQDKLLSLEPCLIFAIADIKLTTENKIKVLEFGRGFQSGFVGYDNLYPGNPLLKIMTDTVLHQFGKDFLLFIGSENDIERRDLLQALLKKVNSSPIPSVRPRKFSDYKGIHGGPEAYSTHHDILVVDNSLEWQMVAEDKYLMHLLFEKEALLTYRPKCQVYPRRYEPSLTDKIKKEISASLYVLKVPDLCQGEGVLVIESHELDAVLRILLGQGAEELTSAYKDYFIQLAKLKGRAEADKRLDQIEKAADNWNASNAGFFLAEEYCPSKLVEFNHKKYDATVRVAFLIATEQGATKCTPLGCYWKLPERPFQEGQLHEHTISHVQPNKVSSVKVSESDREIIYQELKWCMPRLFQRLFFTDISKIIQTLQENADPCYQKQAHTWRLHSANVLGHTHRFEEAQLLYKQIKHKDSKYYHEKGLFYYVKADYFKATDKFNEAIKMNPANGPTFFRRAKAYEALGKQQEALNDLKKAEEKGHDPKIIEYEIKRLMLKNN